MKTSILRLIILLISVSIWVENNTVKAQTPIACNEDVSASLSSNGEVDIYTFDAEPGDVVIIRMQQNNSDVNPKLRLKGPGIDETKIGGNSAARIGAVQLVGGSYTIYASDNGNNGTGSYGISLQFIKGSCAQSIACSADLTATLFRKAEMDAFTFEVVDSGEYVIARIAEDNNDDMVPRLELYKVGSISPIDTTVVPNDFISATRLDATNLMPGTYVLVVLDLLGDENGDYGLSLQFVKGSCAQSIECDAELESYFSNTAEMEAFTFEVTNPGEFVIAQMAQIDMSVYSKLELYREGNPTPMGNLVNLPGLQGYARIHAPNLDPGKYVMIAYNGNGNSLGDYGITLRFVNASCSEPISCGDDVFDDIDKFGEIDAYTFDVSDTVGYVFGRMVGYNHFLDCVLQLYRIGSPSVIGDYSIPIGLSGGAEVKTTDLLPGSYVLLAFSRYSSDTGRYSLSLELMKPECGQQVNCAGSVEGVIEYEAGLDTYYFNRESCDSMIITVANPDTWFNEKFWLFGDDGTLIDSAVGSWNSLAQLTVPLSDYPYEGYLVLIGEENGNTGGSYFLTLLCEMPLLTNPTSVSSNALGGSKQLIINTTCADWTLQGGNSWFSVDQTSGSGPDTVAINYEPNLTTSNRTSSITLHGCCKNLNINITQGGVALNTNPNPLNVSNEGGTNSFFVNSTCIDWTMTLPSNAPWISSSTSDGTGSTAVFLTISPNCSAFPRSATISLSGCGLTSNLLVTQAGTIFDLSPSPINLGVPAGQANLNLMSNCNDWEIEDDADWLSLDQASGSYNGNLTLVYEKNYSPSPRSAIVTLTGCCSSKMIVVSQMGVVLDPSPNSLNLGSGGGQSSLGITSNCDVWTLTESASWLTTDPSQGSFDKLVTISYEANTDCTNRTDTITLAGCGLEYSLLAVQVADTIPSLIPNSRLTGADAGSTSFMVSGNCLWTVNENDDWISISEDGGVVNVVFDQNMSGQSRTAIIGVSCCGETSNFELTQLAFSLIASPAAITVGNNAGQSSLDVITGCDNWVIEETIPWLEVMPEQGSLSMAVSLNYTDNIDTVLRHDSIIVTGCGLSYTVYISQEGASAVDEGHEPADMLVFPNPSSANTFTVGIPMGTPPCTLYFCDEVGRKIKVLPVQGGSQVVFQTAGLPSGVYLLQLQVGEGRIGLAKKVVLIGDQ